VNLSYLFTVIDICVQFCILVYFRRRFIWNFPVACVCMAVLSSVPVDLSGVLIDFFRSFEDYITVDHAVDRSLLSSRRCGGTYVRGSLPNSLW